MSSSVARWLLPCALTLAIAPAAAAERGYRSLAMAITPVRGEDAKVCEAIYHAYRNQVIALQRFTVVERDDSRMTALIREGAFGASGLVDAASAPKLGKLLGVGYFAFLEYDELETSYQANKDPKKAGTYTTEISATVRFVDTTTGEAVDAFEVEGSGSDGDRQESVGEAIEDLVDEMVVSTRDVFALTAGIVDRDGRTVIVSLGRGQGLESGTYFEVFRKTAGIRKRVGRIRITDLGKDRSEAVIKDGYWTLRKGDTIAEDPRGRRPITIGAGYEYMPVTGTLAGSASGFAAQAGPGHGVSLQALWPEVVGDSVDVGLGLGYLMLGGTGTSGLFGDLLGRYRIEVVPEVFQLDLYAGPSVLRVAQAKGNYLGPASDLQGATDDSFSGWGFGGTAGVRGTVFLSRSLSLSAGAGYRIASPVTAWAIGRGKNSPDFVATGADKLAYPSIGLNGLSFQGGVAVTF